MATFTELREVIRGLEPELRAAAGNDAPKFDAALKVCDDEYKVNGEAAIAGLKLMLAMFPALANLLHEKHPLLFPISTTVTTTNTTTGGSPTVTALPAASSTSTGTTDNATGGWTSQQVLQAVKELIAGIIGIALVVFTLQVARIALDNIANPDQLAAAKDILLVMNTLVGVVLGYYFGRLPSDAHATTAQQQADAANGEAAQISQKAAELSTQLAPLAPTEGSTRGQAVTTDLERIRRELLDLAARPSRR